MNSIWKKLVMVIVAFILICIFLIGVPLIVSLVTTAHLLSVNTESQWIGFWGNYLGALIGGFISGTITLLVMIRTLGDGKKERKLVFCDKIVEECMMINNSATVVTLTTQKFLQTAQEKYHDEATSYKNDILDDIWKLVIKLEAKHSTYKFSTELYENIVSIADFINSFSINDLDYVDEKCASDIVNKLVQSEEYIKVTDECFRAAKNIEIKAKELAENVRKFYTENTKQII